MAIERSEVRTQLEWWLSVTYLTNLGYGRSDRRSVQIIVGKTVVASSTEYVDVQSEAEQISELMEDFGYALSNLVTS